MFLYHQLNRHLLLSTHNFDCTLNFLLCYHIIFGGIFLYYMLQLIYLVSFFLPFFGLGPFLFPFGPFLFTKNVPKRTGPNGTIPNYKISFISSNKNSLSKLPSLSSKTTFFKITCFNPS